MTENNWNFETLDKIHAVAAEEDPKLTMRQSDRLAKYKGTKVVRQTVSGGGNTIALAKHPDQPTWNRAGSDPFAQSHKCGRCKGNTSYVKYIKHRDLAYNKKCLVCKYDVQVNHSASWCERCYGWVCNRCGSKGFKPWWEEEATTPLILVLRFFLLFLS